MAPFCFAFLLQQLQKKYPVAGNDHQKQMHQSPMVCLDKSPDELTWIGGLPEALQKIAHGVPRGTLCGFFFQGLLGSPPPAVGPESLLKNEQVKNQFMTPFEEAYSRGQKKWRRPKPLRSIAYSGGVNNHDLWTQ